MVMKHAITQERLFKSGYSLIKDENTLGGYRILHTNARGQTVELKSWVNTKIHPNGHDKSYILTKLSLVEEDGTHKQYSMPLHRLVYIYYKGNYPEGYDISHKDDDSFNCDIDNLEAVPHRDNVRNRKVVWANQYGCKYRVV